MKQKLVFAPGVEFFEMEHEYYLDGKKLSGITGRIAKRLGVKMPEDFAGEARSEGIHIHKAIETWLNQGTWDSIHPGALWIKQRIEADWADPTTTCTAEVLVSDFDKFASSVDIIGKRDHGGFVLYDIKRSFKRTYVTWQLSIYKYFIDKFAERVSKNKPSVEAMYCVAVKDRTVYPIFPYPVADVEALLYDD